MVQWLRLHAPNTGGPGSIPGQGTRSHMPPLSSKVQMLQLKIPHATTKTQCSQKKKSIDEFLPGNIHTGMHYLPAVLQVR